MCEAFCSEAIVYLNCVALGMNEHVLMSYHVQVQKVPEGESQVRRCL